jgi:putative intracellular protease/amidase
MDFTKHSEVLIGLKASQDSDSDIRSFVREAHHFVNKRDGQWEPSIVTKMSNRPRYTFDKCNPIVDQIAGEIDQADFDIRVRPGGGDATKETAKTFTTKKSYTYSNRKRKDSRNVATSL